MNTASVSEDRLRKDNDHLKLLSVFHFVVSGLAILGIAFLCLHYFIMSTFFSHPEMWKPTKGVDAPPKEFFEHFIHVFVWFYLFMGVMFAAAFVLNIISGIFLRQKRHRMFSLIVAGLNCLQIPFGTALGVFTIIVLLRDSVRQSYVD